MEGGSNTSFYPKSKPGPYKRTREGTDAAQKFQKNSKSQQF